jgi:3D (Asp-Asp-Asp) domain-containing protein
MTLIEVVLSAYTLHAHCVGRWAGIGLTASGTRAVPGVTAAASKQCFPRGTWVELPPEVAPEVHLSNGYRPLVYIVEDTGSELTRRAKLGECRLDLLIGGNSEAAVRWAKDYGIKRARVRVIVSPRPR